MARTGSRGIGFLIELRCGSCGYGISVAEPPAACPMCQASDWRSERPRPGAPSLDDVDSFGALRSRTANVSRPLVKGTGP